MTDSPSPDQPLPELAQSPLSDSPAGRPGTGPDYGEPDLPAPPAAPAWRLLPRRLSGDARAEIVPELRRRMQNLLTIAIITPHTLLSSDLIAPFGARILQLAGHIADIHWRTFGSLYAEPLLALALLGQRAPRRC